MIKKTFNDLDFDNVETDIDKLLDSGEYDLDFDLLPEDDSISLDEFLDKFSND